MKTDISLELAARLSERVNRAFESGEMLQAVSPVTADLLKYWFTEPYFSERACNFHSGQRQAILFSWMWCASSLTTISPGREAR